MQTLQALESTTIVTLAGCGSQPMSLEIGDKRSAYWLSGLPGVELEKQARTLAEPRLNRSTGGGGNTPSSMLFSRLDIIHSLYQKVLQHAVKGC